MPAAVSGESSWPCRRRTRFHSVWPCRARNTNSHERSAKLSALQLAPATGAVVRDDLLDHRGQGAGIDGLALADGHGTGGLVVVPAGDDPLGIRDDGAVVEEHVDVILRRQQRADVPAEHEVRTVGELDGLDDLRV